LQFYETGVYFEPNCDPQMLNHAVLGEICVFSNNSALLCNFWSF
jgi:hypothetical protein